MLGRDRQGRGLGIGACFLRRAGGRRHRQPARPASRGQGARLRARHRPNPTHAIDRHPNGPGFFTALKKSGLKAQSDRRDDRRPGAITAGLIHVFAGVPCRRSLGVLGRAVTNTPSLGAAQQVLRDMGLPAARRRLIGPRSCRRLSVRHRRQFDDDGGAQSVFRVDPEHAKEFEAKRCRRSPRG